MATLKNTIAKAEKLTGTKIVKDEYNQYSFIYKTRIITFYANGTGENAESHCFYSESLTNRRTTDDRYSDYFPGIFHDNLGQAIRFIDKYRS